MKAVIIGGGIAGLLTSILLHQNDWEVKLFEKKKILNSTGLGFLVNTNSLKILNTITQSKVFKLKFKKIKAFDLKNANGSFIKSVDLKEWNSIKRSDIINFLYQLLPQEFIVEQNSFSHFIYDNDKAIGAVFENGTIEYADLFIGADGANSLVRSKIIDEVVFCENEVKEVVCIVKDHGLHIAQDRFTKFKLTDVGLSFGFVPLSKEEFIWFMQYDHKHFESEFKNAGGNLQLFCKKILKDFPEEVRKIVEKTDFANAYLWHTKDFNLLPRFHVQNIIIVGDAAHLTLPFTSSGVNFAIVDAQYLANLLLDSNDFDKVGKDFYEFRKNEIQNTIDLGRNLKNEFLSPSKVNYIDFILPLIKPN